MLYQAGGPYGDYSRKSSYWFRIVAEYPFGESPLDGVVPFIPLEQVKSQMVQLILMRQIRKRDMSH